MVRIMHTRAASRREVPSPLAFGIPFLSFFDDVKLIVFFTPSPLAKTARPDKTGDMWGAKFASKTIIGLMAAKTAEPPTKTDSEHRGS